MTGLKQKICNGEFTLGSWLSIANTSIAEIMSRTGFDWLTIDMEHSALSIDQVQELIRVIDLSGVAPFVRLSENNPTLIKRVMDAGAHGIVVPMVNSREEAERAVAAMHYPPSGFRGVGLSRAQGYGTSFDEYRNWNRESSILVVQIEHIKAVENLQSILTVNGVDAFIIGPYDLSGSLGVPGDFFHPRMVEAMNEIIRIAQKANSTPGYHVVQPNPQHIFDKVSEGYKFLAYGVDFLFLGEMCRSGVQTIRQHYTLREGK